MASIPPIAAQSIVTSEALQSTIRRLLPSQQGFGVDLIASNVITPIIDVTPTAEGSQLPTGLRESISYGGSTAFAVFNATTTVASTAGFYRIDGNSAATASAGAFQVGEIIITDGATPKSVKVLPTGTDYDLILFLDTGISVQIKSPGASFGMFGSIRQIADRYGNLSNPSGFTFE